MPGSWIAACANTGVAVIIDNIAAALRIFPLVIVYFLHVSIGCEIGGFSEIGGCVPVG
jgi:hypothetical protein